VKNETGYMLADSDPISNICRTTFLSYLNEYIVSDIKQIEVHTAETLVPGPSRYEVETAIAINSNAIDSVWNKDDLRDQWK
jgi:hypothetical protein